MHTTFTFYNLVFFLNKLDRQVGYYLKKIKLKLNRIDQIVWFGGSKGFRKKRSGYWVIDVLNNYWYEVWRILDMLDTAIFFPDHIYQTKTCRVRSKGEKKIADFLYKQNIVFIYEKKLELDGITLKPDFFCPEYNIYIEFWGPYATSSKYRAERARKIELYNKHNIAVIGLFPRDLPNLEKALISKLLRKGVSKN